MCVYNHAFAFPQSDEVTEKHLIHICKPKLSDFPKIQYTTINIQAYN